MKANELRIGNWVFNKAHERTQLKEVYSDCSVYDSIPLTEEWLKRFDWFSIDDDKYTFRDIEYYSISSNGRLYFNCGYTATDIKYVHQLQNLYFALTGEELTTDNNKQ